MREKKLIAFSLFFYLDEITNTFFLSHFDLLAPKEERNKFVWFFSVQRNKTRVGFFVAKEKLNRKNYTIFERTTDFNEFFCTYNNE